MLFIEVVPKGALAESLDVEGIKDEEVRTLELSMVLNDAKDDDKVLLGKAMPLENK